MKPLQEIIESYPDGLVEDSKEGLEGLDRYLRTHDYSLGAEDIRYMAYLIKGIKSIREQKEPQKTLGSCLAGIIVQEYLLKELPAGMRSEFAGDDAEFNRLLSIGGNPRKMMTIAKKYAPYLAKMDERIKKLGRSANEAATPGNYELHYVNNASQGVSSFVQIAERKLRMEEDKKRETK
ncbi:hypothetical protein COV19_01255 [Candidatus Woesearchaeota archaeon CG10_big_fil_rev_8_21_14_0_10_44_13]|nr:MAG: hypothetical protein COV19_01255 [Candidatus Woesearchaeota archaeon CG10_big_fil_rev_8_21_14_0_10_44_13]